jgi:hypothetical protein
MNCPPAIADVLLKILQLAILRIRASGWSGDAVLCALEADHIHNLPGLLADYTGERLRYYWEAERPSFVRQSDPDNLATYVALWEQLETLLPGSPATR